jgi:hypothetical protein
MGNKDGYTLERIYAGAEQKVARFEIVRTEDFSFQQHHIVRNALFRIFLYYIKLSTLLH